MASISLKQPREQDTGMDKKRIEQLQQWKSVYEKGLLEEAAELIFEPESWLTAFSLARSRDAQNNLRLVIQDGTRRACLPSNRGEFGYYLPNGEYIVYATRKQDIVKQISSSTLRIFDKDESDWEGIFERRMPNPDEEVFETKINVIKGDCLDVAESLLEQGLNPVVLNMASDFKPGGGYQKGAGAQEENLFRRTNLLHVLANEMRWLPAQQGKILTPNKFYPLPDHSVIYSPEAWVFRGSEASGYPFLNKPFKVAFVASAAYRHPRLLSDNIHITAGFARGTEQKIRAIFSTASQYGHDSIVLSAWGCGAFGNPPLHMAQLFQKVLQEDWIKARFKNITFAIIDDANSRGNLQSFIDVFQPPSSTLSNNASTLVGGQKIVLAKSVASIPGGERKPKCKKNAKKVASSSSPTAIASSSSSTTTFSF